MDLKISDQLTDSLRLYSNGTGYLYSAEDDYKDSIIYFIKGDTLTFNEYNFISEVNAYKGQHIVSKWVLLLKGEILKIFFLAHWNENHFEEVQEKIFTNLR